MKLEKISPDEAKKRRLRKSDWMAINLGNTKIMIVKNEQDEVTIAKETTNVTRFEEHNQEHIEESKIREYYKLIP